MGGPDPLIEFCLATDKKFQKGCATGLHLKHYDSVSALQSKYELFASSIFYGNYYILRLYLCRTC